MFECCSKTICILFAHCAEANDKKIYNYFMHFTICN